MCLSLQIISTLLSSFYIKADPNVAHLGCHNTQHNDIRHNYTQHNWLIYYTQDNVIIYDTQHNVIIYDTQHNGIERTVL